MNHAILPDGWKRPPGFSEGRSAEPGNTIVVAGQLGLRKGDGEPAGSNDFVAQWGLALERLVDVVRAGGGTPEDVVSLRVYVTDLAEYRAAASDLGASWGATLGRHFPAMTMVEVSGLLEEDAKVEIEGVAVVGGGSA